MTESILSQLGLATPEVDGWGYAWAFAEEFGVEEDLL
jgi:hypothetical protein